VQKATKVRLYPGRQWLVLGSLLAIFGLLAIRSGYLQMAAKDYLQAQGDARYSRVEQVSATRGMIVDRHGEPLAISTPVDSVWADPGQLIEGKAQWPQLAKLLGVSAKFLAEQWTKNADREFMYLRRHATPELAAKIMALQVPGVFARREYRRFYPTGATTSHVLGFTDIDDKGQEGIEVAFDRTLAGEHGLKRVIKDRLGRIIEDVENIKPVVDGQDLMLSIDSRIQHLLYQHLRTAVRQHNARGASAIVLDPHNGELLAMANEPGFNPNDRRQLSSSRFRNRAVTDVLEPGSTVKPFTIAMALAQGDVKPTTPIDTAPGILRVGKHSIKDTHDYGTLTVSRVVMKSSNVGAAKIALQSHARNLYEFFRGVGFGVATSSGLPGEVAGTLVDRGRWRDIEHATLAFGYGVAITPLQLARAYGVLANGGRMVPVTMLKRRGAVRGRRVIPERTVREVTSMLELAVSDGGTGSAAQVPQYRVAGKTGTVHKFTAEGYAPDRYTSLFAGYAPATDPRLVMVVVIDDPRGKQHYGGAVAAPVFSRVMTGALRLLNVPPDQATPPIAIAAAGSATGI